MIVKATVFVYDPTSGPNSIGLVHDDCERVISRDLVQLPAAGLAHRHVCEASHTANVQNNLHMYRKFPNLDISNEFDIACSNQTAGSNNLQMYSECDEEDVHDPTPLRTSLFGSFNSCVDSERTCQQI